jgi:nucleoprotein TPR
LFQAPLLNQQRRDLERVQSESLQLASQLAQAIADRDGNAAHVQELSQRFQKSERENSLLQQQLEDLGRQVQALLREVARRDDPSIPSDEEIEKVAPAENVDGLITNNLVLFKSIPALQEQNQKLLKITREMGMRMEAEEKEYKDALERDQLEAIREAHEAIQALQVQLENQQRSHQNTIQAYAKERDTLKTMLSRVQREGAGSVVQVNGHSRTNGGEADTTQGTGKQDDAQSTFEAYRHEMSMDAVKLREEVMSYQREIGQLGASLAKANAKIEHLNGEYFLIISCA